MTRQPWKKALLRIPVLVIVICEGAFASACNWLITDCRACDYMECTCPPGASARTDGFLARRPSANVSQAGESSPGVEGGSTGALTSFLDSGCAPFGSAQFLPADAIFSAKGSAAWVSDGVGRSSGPSWAGVTPGALGLSGSTFNTATCAGGKLLVGTDKGMEWISLKDRSTGIFTAPSWGNGATAIAVVDSGHVLAGVAPPPGASAGFNRVLLCDVAATSCVPRSTGIPDASVTAEAVVGFASTGGSHLAAVLARGGVYGSADGGQTWTKASGLPASAFSYNGVAGSGSNVWVSTSSGLYRMGASETSWSLGGPNFAPGSPIPTSAVAVQGSITYAAFSNTVYKSTDGGGSWSTTGAGIPAGIGAIAITPNYLWTGTGAGVYRSADGGSTWSAYSAGLNNASISKVVVSGSSTYAVTNNGSGFFRSTDSCASWTQGSPSLAGKSFIAMAASGNTVLFSGSGGLYRSTDGGATVSALSPPKTFLSLAAVGANFLGVSGGPPIALYRSTDSGTTWATYGSGFPTSGGVGGIPPLAVNGNTVVVAIGAAVSRSLDGGATWTSGSAVAGPFEFDGLAFAGNTLWAAASIGTTTGLYKSDDLGITWTRSSAGPPQAREIAVSGSRLLAGTTDGTFTSTDGGATWSRFHDELAGVYVYSVAVSGGTACVGTISDSILGLPFAATVRRLVPVVLDVVGLAHYTTELTLTNRGTSDSQLTLQYTASLGSGSGTASEILHHGSNLVIPDVIAYLRGKGLSIPNDGSGQAGTLLVTFDGLSEPDVASAVARTTAATLVPQPVGSAGLAYTAVDPGRGATGALTVYGLRSTSTDRSNLAVYNTTADPVTFSVTAFSGDGTGTSAVVSAATTLPAWGWTQFNRIMDGVGFANGWVTVARTSTTGAFGMYGVINDNVTNDGSFVVSAPGDARPLFLNVPVLVETGSFVSELVLTNSSTKPADFQILYHESLTPGAPGNQGIVITVPPLTQRILPGVIDWLRSMNIAVGPRGAASYAGGLNVVVVSGGGVGRLYAGARTASPSPAGGQYGLFTPAAFAGDEATSAAYIYGLHADANNRSNVAAVNTAQDPLAGSITLSITVFDGDAGGGPRGSYTLTLAPGQWEQISGILATAGVSNGWVRVSRTSGSAPWIAYGVVNDGGAPGQRTGDGAYVPMEVP